MKFTYAHGATPLDPNEIDGLLPPHIVTQEQLNEWEETNILEAEQWAFAHKRSTLEHKFCITLHNKMFDQTWEWAGKFRNSDKNIGVPWEQISTQLKMLFDNTKYHIEKNIYSLDEIAARFHHKLVYIHPFPNGNGRHSRLMTDILLFNNGVGKFTWGQTDLTSNNKIRVEYINALRDADKGNYIALFNFVRS